MSKLSQNDAEVLKTLKSTKRPQSAYEILNALNAVNIGRIKVPMQVYRSLEKLINQKLVHRIASQNVYIACDHPHHDFEPGFFKCQKCGSVSEFNFSQAMDRLRTASGAPFIESISVEIEGTCEACL